MKVKNNTGRFVFFLSHMSLMLVFKGQGHSGPVPVVDLGTGERNIQRRDQFLTFHVGV